MKPNSKTSLPKRASEDSSEKAFYARKAQRAKLASQQAATGLLQSLGRALSPKSWARHYPVSTAGVSLGLGFLLGRKVSTPRPVPSKKKATPSSSGIPVWNVLSQWGLGTLSDILKAALIPVLRDSLNSIKKPRNPDPHGGGGS